MSPRPAPPGPPATEHTHPPLELLARLIAPYRALPPILRWGHGGDDSMARWFDDSMMANVVVVVDVKLAGTRSAKTSRAGRHGGYLSLPAGMFICVQTGRQRRQGTEGKQPHSGKGWDTPMLDAVGRGQLAPAGSPHQRRVFTLHWVLTMAPAGLALAAALRETRLYGGLVIGRRLVGVHTNPLHATLSSWLKFILRALPIEGQIDKMATPDVYILPGTPEAPIFVKKPNSPTFIPSSKATHESLKRSFARYLASEYASPAVGKLFVPSAHLAYEEPKYIHTMEDLGYTASQGVSPVAVSEPFPLFSEDAVNIMRREILDKEVLENYSYASDIAPKQIRGYAPKHGKFIFEAWKHPETLSIISKIAGVDLVPVMDYEIGHVNLSVPKQKKDHHEGEDEQPIVGWHRDSYPFVCVLMMSDTTGMVGGETALRTGTGEIKKVRGPQKGCAVVLQGRYIDHQALAAFGGQERITMVTSFRPRSPSIRDDTVLTTVRPISNLSDLYGQTIEYQLENAESRIRRMLKRVRDSMKAGATDVSSIKSFLDFEINTLLHLNQEIVDESLVVKGHLAGVCDEAENHSKRAGATTSKVNALAQNVAGLSREATPSKSLSAVMAKPDPDLASKFKADLTDLRNLATCSICDQLLYEPWTLGCGHTYCYSVKQMVEIFIKRSEMMPSDESIDQHQQKRSEELAAVEKDRNGPEGLFKGTFPEPKANPWLDEADGVMRCPSCGHECEGDSCETCGAEFDDDEFDEYGFTDMDEPLDEEELEDLEVDVNYELHGVPHPYMPFHGYHYHHHFHQSHLHALPSSQDEDSNSEGEIDEDSDEDVGSLQGFIVQDEEGDNRQSSRASNPHPLTISDDESDEGGAISNRRPRRANRRNSASPSIVTVTDESSNGSESGDVLDDAETLRRSGWSPLDQDDDESDSEGDGEDDDDPPRNQVPAYSLGAGGYDNFESEDGHETEEESDTETMVGNLVPQDDDNGSRGSLSGTPRFSSVDYDQHVHPTAGGNQDCITDENDVSSEVTQSSPRDHDGDTEMSVSPRASRGTSVISTDYGYEERGVSVSEDGHGHGMGEDLGAANEIHDLEEESSEDSIRPAQRRRPRNYMNPRVQQQYDPRISSMFAEHQLRFAEHQLNVFTTQNRLPSLGEWNTDVRRVETAASRIPQRMTAYRMLPTRRADPLRNARSPSVTRIVSSSMRSHRTSRYYHNRTS
ncbi:hypothetical protein B7494_g1200 [Chlorociboria aeruginascens]|nr:hypothetical protein B7494_g1200 [Chlorociboria aeruginascens]